MIGYDVSVRRDMSDWYKRKHIKESLDNFFGRTPRDKWTEYLDITYKGEFILIIKDIAARGDVQMFRIEECADNYIKLNHLEKNAKGRI